MIRLNDVSFKYDKQPILNMLSLFVSKKEVVAIVGSSGCGKSTLLNLISGQLKPNDGEIMVNSENLAYLMQDVTLLPYKTVMENTLLACILRKRYVDKETKEKAINILQLFQIETNSINKFPNELSGGMKQRIGLAQTLLTDPELLLLDEPFNAVDVNALEAIEEYIWKYVKEGGRTMLFITHNIEQALLLSDRVVIMGNNHIVHEVNPSSNFIDLPPSLRTNTPEFKILFFEIIEKMKL